MNFSENEKEQVIKLLYNYLHKKRNNNKLNNNYELNNKQEKKIYKIKNSWMTNNSDEYILEEICFLCKKLVKS
jgi:hypothetical protein